MSVEPVRPLRKTAIFTPSAPVALLGFLIGPFAWPHAVADQILSLALD